MDSSKHGLWWTGAMVVASEWWSGFMCGFVFYDDDSDSNMLRARARSTYQAYHSMQCDFVAKCFVYYIFSDGLSGQSWHEMCSNTGNKEIHSFI